MKSFHMLFTCTILHLFTSFITASNVRPGSPSVAEQFNITEAQLSLGSTDSRTNLTADSQRYNVPGSSIALDIYDYRGMPTVPRDAFFVCIIEALSSILGKPLDQLIPRLNTFKYKMDAFIHIQDLNPTQGREHTYADLAATLRGLAEYAAEFKVYRELEFQIWTITPEGKETKIGSGGVGGSMRSLGGMFSQLGDHISLGDATNDTGIHGGESS